MSLIDDGSELAAEVAAHIAADPGCSTAQLATRFAVNPSEMEELLYRFGRHYGVGLSALDGWQHCCAHTDVAERLRNGLPPTLPPR